METSFTDLQGKHADIMAIKMKLEKQVANLNSALDKEKSSQSDVSDQIQELDGERHVFSHLRTAEVDAYFRYDFAFNFFVRINFDINVFCLVLSKRSTLTDSIQADVLLDATQ